MQVEISKKLLLELDPAAVRRYAVQAGWKEVQGIKRPVIVLNHPDDDLAQLHIPLAGTDRERAYMMGEVVRQLVATEKGLSDEVLNDLASPPQKLSDS